MKLLKINLLTFILFFFFSFSYSCQVGVDGCLHGFDHGSGQNWENWTYHDPIDGFGWRGFMMDENHPLWSGPNLNWDYGRIRLTGGFGANSGGEVYAEIDTSDYAPSTSSGGSLRIYDSPDASQFAPSLYVWQDRFNLNQRGITDSTTDRMSFYLKTEGTALSAMPVSDSVPADIAVDEWGFHIGTYLCWDSSCAWNGGEGPGNQHYYHYLSVNPGAWIHVELNQYPQHRRSGDGPVVGNNPSYVLSDRNYFEHMSQFYMEVRRNQDNPSSINVDEIKFYSTQNSPEPNQNEVSITSTWVGYWEDQDYWEISWMDNSFYDFPVVSGRALSTFEVKWSTSPITNDNYDQATLIEPMFYSGSGYTDGRVGAIRKANSDSRTVWTRFQLPDDVESSNNIIYFAIKDISVVGEGGGSPEEVAYWIYADNDGHNAPTDNIRTIDYHLRAGDSAPQPLTITTSTLPLGSLSSSYSTTLAASGGTSPYTYSTSSSLPRGLTLSSSGILSGTPIESGNFSLTFQVEDSNSEIDTQTLNLEILSPDTQSPIFSLSSPSTSFTNQVTITGSLDDNVGISNFSYICTQGCLSSGIETSSFDSISIDVTLSEGSNIIFFEGFDISGNSANTTLSITYSVPQVVTNLTSVNQTIVIDSLYSDWSGIDRVPILIETLGPTTSSDLSGFISSSWDQENLYFLINVTDDVATNDGNYWEDDTIGFHFDSQNDNSLGMNSDDLKLLISRSGVFSIDPISGSNLGSGLSSSNFLIQDLGSSYLVELYIPFSDLGLDSSSLEAIGFDVALYDDDDGGSQDSELRLFSSQRTGASSSEDTSEFGDLIFSGDSFTQPVIDTESPSLVSNFTYSSLTQNSLVLNWDAATDNVGVTGYQLFRDSIFIVNVTSSLTQADSGLSPNTTYTYEIAAFDAVGNVGPLTSLDITTLEESQGPQEDPVEEDDSGSSSSGGGSGGSSGGGSSSSSSSSFLSSSAYVPSTCEPNYEESSWSGCLNGFQTRTITDVNGCKENIVETRACKVDNSELENRFLNAKQIVINQTRDRVYSTDLKGSYNEIVYMESKLEESFVLVDKETGSEYLGRLIEEEEDKFYYSLERIDQSLLNTLKDEGLIQETLGEEISQVTKSSTFFQLMIVLGIFSFIVIIFVVIFYIKKLHRKETFELNDK